MWKRELSQPTIMAPNEWVNASEYGRLRAAASITMNPDARYRVEQVYGKEHCMKRWPEAYGKPQTGGFMRAFKDAVHAAKTLIPILLVAFLVNLGITQAQEVQKPRVYAGTGLYVKNTAGYVYNGGHRVTIAASTGSGTLLTDTQTSCAAPAFSACNFLYANSSGTIANTVTIGTAATPGNVLLALIETTGGAITRLAPANMSDTIALQALGQTGTFSSAPLPATAGNIDIASNAYPFQSAYLGNAATNNIRFLPGTTAAGRTVNFCDPIATAVCFSDPSVLTQQIKLNASGATGAATLSFTNSAARTYTVPDVGGNATVAFINPTSTQTFAAGSDFSSAILPHATGIDLGAAATAFRYAYLFGDGTYSSTSLKLTGTPTGNRVVTFPDAAITVSGATGQWCNNTNACAATATSTNMKIISGVTASLNGASPAIATVTGISPAFTSSSTFVCTVTGVGVAAPTKVLNVSNVSASSFTITGPNADTELVNYICVGY